jgi:Transmembrane secretion effector
MTNSDYTAAPGKPRARPALRQGFAALHEPVFRRWFFSQALSGSGTMTQAVAESWLVLRLTGSGVDLGLLASCLFLPMLVMGPYAGLLADRIDRRRLLIVTQSLLLVLAGLLAALTASGSIRLWTLLVIAAATGTVSAPDFAGRQVYAIELVGAERVASAVGLNEVVLNASRVLGPAAGGALLAALGVPACCVLNAASYLPSLLILLAHRAPDPPRPAPGRGAAGRGARPGQLRAGARYAWSHRAIRASVFLAAASGMLFNLNVPLPLFATRVFRLGGGGFGLMMAVFGLGALPGAMLAASARSRPGGREVGLLALATGLSVLATASAADLGLALVGLAVTGCLSIWFIARANTLVQVETEPTMRGRLMGIWNMALPGCQPITGPLVGWVAGAAGAREGFGLAGLALVLTAGLGWRGLTGRTDSCPSPDTAPPPRRASPRPSRDRPGPGNR